MKKNITLKKIWEGAKADKWTANDERLSCLLEFSHEECGCFWFDVYAASVNGVLHNKLDTLCDTELLNHENGELVIMRFDEDGEMYCVDCDVEALIESKGEGVRFLVGEW